MRNNLVLSLLGALLLTACDPVIRKFEVQPQQLQCSGQVLVSWEISGPGGKLGTSKPVTPPLPSDPPLKGSQSVTVTESTDFSFVVPGAGHKHQSVKVSGTPQPKMITFQGQCNGAGSGPLYNSVNVTAAEAPGKLTSVQGLGLDFPVHVFLNGTQIALGADGQPLFPLPDLPAAGSYTVQIPGVPGEEICKEAGGGDPVGGGTAPAPEIAIAVKGSCS